MTGSPKGPRRRRAGRRLLVPAVVLAVTLLLPAAAQAATTYVDQGNADCTNSGTGTASRPFCSISAAAANTTAGTTVLVSSGTYVEQVSVRSGAANSPVVFKAAPGATPIVRGGNYGWYVSGKSWVTIEGFTVTDTASHGFHVSSGSHHIDVVRNRVYETGEPISGKTGMGISVTDSSDVRVDGNTVERVSTYGIYLDDSTRVEIVRNTSTHNAKRFDRAASGIRLFDSDANTIASNVTHHNEDSGIELVANSDGNVIAGNVAYEDRDHGIDLVSSRDNRVVANTVHRSLTSGINVEAGSTGTTLANNIAVDNGINSPRATGNLRVDSASTLATTLDYDLVHLSAPGHNLNWNGLGYASLAQFKAAVGQEQHGIEADPRWVSPSTADFALDRGSPAIDSADSAASGHPSSDAAGNPRVDVPSVPNTGVGPRAYDDRGAYEQQLRNQPPIAALAASPPSGDVDLTVVADASGSIDADGVAGIADYTFDFGDGSPAAGPQDSAAAEHTYTAAGTYTVRVTVRDAGGLSSTAAAQVTVTDDPPRAALTVTPSSGLAPLEVTADASGSTDTDATPIATYSFDFGDGSPTVGPRPEATADHTYLTGGSHTVTVTVTDTAGLSTRATAVVSVSAGGHSPPTAALAVTPDTGAVDLAVTADASASTDADGSSPIESYRFDFGDGSAVVGPQPEATAHHVYTSPGTYTVTVTVTDTASLSATETRRVVVRDDPPAARLTVTPSAGFEPLQITADASGSTDDDATPIVGYRFDFGDGTPAVGPQSGATANHTYAAAGTYTVTVTVIDAAGLTGTGTAQVLVRGNSVRNPGFETGLTGWNVSGSEVTLERTGDGHGGDFAARVVNTGSTTATCTLNDSPDWVRSTSTGTYTGSLWVRGDTPGGVLKLRFREWAGPTLVGMAVGQVTLTSSWQQVTTSYTAQAPGATLDFNAYMVGAAPGTCFRADDARIVQSTAADQAPAAALTVTPASATVGAQVQADASGSTDDDGISPIESYRFDFGDGTPAVGPQSGSTAHHAYAAAGTYTVTVTVTDTAGLSATSSVPVVVGGNLIRNPGFEADLAGWNSPAGVSLQRSADAHSGTHGVTLANTGTVAATCTLNDSPDWARPTLAGTYTGSLWVRADAPGATLKLRLREWSGSSLVGTAGSQIALAESWQPISTTYSVQAPGSSLDFNAYVNGAAPGTCFHADDAAIVRE